jgi:hypothetical protein
VSTTVLDRSRLDGRVAAITGRLVSASRSRRRSPAGATDLVLAARRPDRLEQTARLVEERGRHVLKRNWAPLI